MADEQELMMPYMTSGAWPPWSVVARHMERLTADRQQNDNNTKEVQTTNTGDFKTRYR